MAKRIVMKFQLHEPGATFEHLKGVRVLTDQGMLVKPTPKYLHSMLDILGMQTANTAPTPELPGKMDDPGQPLDADKAWDCCYCYFC